MRRCSLCPGLAISAQRKRKLSVPQAAQKQTTIGVSASEIQLAWCISLYDPRDIHACVSHFCGTSTRQNNCPEWLPSALIIQCHGACGGYRRPCAWEEGRCDAGGESSLWHILRTCQSRAPPPDLGRGGGGTTRHTPRRAPIAMLSPVCSVIIGQFFGILERIKFILIDLYNYMQAMQPFLRKCTLDRNLPR